MDPSALLPSRLSFTELMDYIGHCDPPALCNSVHGDDFHSPVFGSYARDESWMASTARSASAARRLLKTAFSDQNYRFARAMKRDDDQDIIDDQFMQVYACSDADRITSRGASYTEVHVDHLNTLRCKLHEGHDNNVVTRFPVGDREWPLKIGDWVLFKATLHRYQSDVFMQRAYYVLAKDLRILDQMVDDTEGSDTTLDSDASPVQQSDNVGPSTGAATPGADTDAGSFIQQADDSATAVLTPSSEVSESDASNEALEVVYTPSTSSKRKRNDAVSDSVPVQKGPRRSSRKSGVCHD
ncbi:hypothetical protein C8R44DRAFT_874495 [Mycena epipterygia]|nr:hypothetical protein C8R44DRAFT_874495 [Mycena epipterygia]